MKYTFLCIISISLFSCKIKSKHKISTIDSSIKTTINGNEITVNQQGNNSTSKIVISNIDTYDPKSDKEINTVQKVSYYDGEYVLDTDGWFHGDIVYSNQIHGTFDYIKNNKLKEKELSDKVIYSKEIQKLKELQ